MSSFTDIPALKQLKRKAESGNTQYVLMNGFEYYVGSKETGIRITVPKGFVTDFASIPRVFQSIFQKDDTRWAKAVILHDYLYETRIFSRAIADLILFEAMKIKTPLWICILFYVAVRIGGNKIYNED